MLDQNSFSESTLSHQRWARVSTCSPASLSSFSSRPTSRNPIQTRAAHRPLSSSSSSWSTLSLMKSLRRWIFRRLIWKVMILLCALLCLHICDVVPQQRSLSPSSSLAPPLSSLPASTSPSFSFLFSNLLSFPYPPTYIESLLFQKAGGVVKLAEAAASFPNNDTNHNRHHIFSVAQFQRSCHATTGYTKSNADSACQLSSGAGWNILTSPLVHEKESGGFGWAWLAVWKAFRLAGETMSGGGIVGMHSDDAFPPSSDHMWSGEDPKAEWARWSFFAHSYDDN